MQHRMHGHFRPGRGPWGRPGRFGPGRHFGPGRPFGPGRRFGPGGVNMTPELRSLIGDVRGLGHYLFRQGMSGALNDTAKVGQLRDIVGRTRAEIEKLFGTENVTTV